MESKIGAMSENDTKLNKNARAVLALFGDKAEWSVPEISNALDMNINTVAKTVKSLVDSGRLIKHGATRGAWYELNRN